MLAPLSVEVVRSAVEFVVPHAKKLEGRADSAPDSGFVCLVIDLHVRSRDKGRVPTVFQYPEEEDGTTSSARLDALDTVAEATWATQRGCSDLVETESSLVLPQHTTRAWSVVRDDCAVIVSGVNPEQNALLADWIAAAIHARRLVAKQHHAERE